MIKLIPILGIIAVYLSSCSAFDSYHEHSHGNPRKSSLMIKNDTILENKRQLTKLSQETARLKSEKKQRSQRHDFINRKNIALKMNMLVLTEALSIFINKKAKREQKLIRLTELRTRAATSGLLENEVSLLLNMMIINIQS